MTFVAPEVLGTQPAWCPGLGTPTHMCIHQFNREEKGAALSRGPHTTTEGEAQVAWEMPPASTRADSLLRCEHLPAPTSLAFRKQFLLEVSLRRGAQGQGRLTDHILRSPANTGPDLLGYCLQVVRTPLLSPGPTVGSRAPGISQEAGTAVPGSPVHTGWAGWRGIGLLEGLTGPIFASASDDLSPAPALSAHRPVPEHFGHFTTWPFLPQSFRAGDQRLMPWPPRLTCQASGLLGCASSTCPSLGEKESDRVLEGAMWWWLPLS